jgi:hypothetical protein
MIYPQSAAGLTYESYGETGQIQDGQPVVTAASANTKGSYVEIAASIGITSQWVLVEIVRATLSVRWLLDIATGAGGGETIVIPDVIGEITDASSHSAQETLVLPWKVESGTRIAGRAQGSSTSASSIFVALELSTFDSDLEGITLFNNEGADTSDSGGLGIDPGAVANTKGAYAELVASLSAIAQWICLLRTIKGNQAASSAMWSIDLSTGAGGGETVLVADTRCNIGATNETLTNRTSSYFTYIAASTRLAVRCQCDITDATDRLLDIALIWGTAPAGGGGGGGDRSYVG